MHWRLIKTLKKQNHLILKPHLPETPYKLKPQQYSCSLYVSYAIASAWSLVSICRLNWCTTGDTAKAVNVMRLLAGHDGYELKRLNLCHTRNETLFRRVLKWVPHGEDSLSAQNLYLNMWQDVSKRCNDRGSLNVAILWNPFQTVSSLFRYNKWLPQRGCAWATPAKPVVYTWALTVRWVADVLTSIMLLIYRGSSKTSE